MHSSRMRTARSSSRPGGGVSTRQPLGPDPPGPGTPPRPGTPRDQAPPCGQTDTYKHITLPQTSFAGGKNTSIFRNISLSSDHPIKQYLPSAIEV